MRRIDPLPGLETNKKTVVSMQRRGKYVVATIEVLLKLIISTPAVKRGYKKDNWAT
jgi:hypothetical protein